MALAGEDPAGLNAILITHEHLDHVAGLAVLARRLKVPVFFTEPTHRAWVRMLTPRTTMSYAKWLEQVQREKEARAVEVANHHAPAHTVLALVAAGISKTVEPEDMAVDGLSAVESLAILAEGGEPEEEQPQIPSTPASQERSPGAPACGNDKQKNGDDKQKSKLNPSFLPEVEYFKAGQNFCIGDIDIDPFTIPHDAADPCGFVFHARHESIRMAIATDLGYIPPNVKQALRGVDVLLLESNHDLEMLKDGPYPWSVKQRVLSRVGHLSNHACAEFLLRDYDGGAHTIVLGHLSEQNNLPELARLAAEQAIGNRMTLLGNRVVLAAQDAPLEPICL